MNTYNKITILMLLVACALRLWSLGAVPQGLANDEAGYIYSAYSIWKTGSDPAGRFLPLSINLDNAFSPVYIYATAPFVGLLGISPFSGRLPFALMSVMGVYFTILLADQLTGNKRVALLSGFFLAVSSWHIHVGRAAFDVNFAYTFYLAAAYFFIRSSYPLSLLSMLFAFYSYHGTKIYGLALAFVLMVIYRDNLKKNKKNLILYIGGLVCIVVSFFIIGFSQNGLSRTSTFLLNDMDKATKAVNWERTANSGPDFLKPVFSNKLLYYLRIMKENYLEAFSTHFLFLYGETTALSGSYAGPHFRGQLYTVELLFLIAGAVVLSRSGSRKLKLVILSLFLISPLPTTFTNDRSYVFRSFMLLLPLSILTASGMNEILRIVSKRNIFLLILITLYGYQIFSYLDQYFFRYSVYGAEAWFTSSKDLALYVKSHKPQYNRTIVADTGGMFVFQYGIYNKIDPIFVNAAWNMPYPKSLDDVSYIQTCVNNGKGDPHTLLPPDTLYITRDSCHPTAEPDEKITDAGEPLRTVWKIYTIRGPDRK